MMRRVAEIADPGAPGAWEWIADPHWVTQLGKRLRQTEAVVGAIICTALLLNLLGQFTSAALFGLTVGYRIWQALVR